MNYLEEISSFMQQGRAPKVKELVSQALEEGIPAKDILEQGLLAGMSVVGEKFKNNQVYVPGNECRCTDSETLSHRGGG